MRIFSLFLGIFAAAVVGVRGQQGDKKGEEQPPPDYPIPEAPALSPSEALKSFKLDPEFSVEIVAAEPLVHDPVAISFDQKGRLWVVEMRAFMPNVDGKGEDDPVGTIAILEDLDRDGKMDKRTEFLTGLVMPRALMVYRDGALVAAPPYLWFCRDTNNDGKADEKIEIAKDYFYVDPKNPEHNANGLLWAMDNWIYSAKYPVKYRPSGTEWRRSTMEVRGQWGISQDDFGRLFHNSNSDQIRYELVPNVYLARNPNFPEPAGGNVQAAASQVVWPARMNPGVNRGYRVGQLKPDHRLHTFTAACAPWIYRGEQFSETYKGNAFVCEPSGNFVRRNILTEKQGQIRAENAYKDSEFLSSTDERFRPVNLADGPDGALYVVDMYRGIIQHRIFVTTFLRRQILERKLETPIGMGRIYRIVQKNRPVPRPEYPQKVEDWVPHLAHPAGWWRDTAQRLLVESKPESAIPKLMEMAKGHAGTLARLHALWTLEGMDQLTVPLLGKTLQDSDAKVRAASIRLFEKFYRSEDREEVLEKLFGMTKDPSFEVKLQLALSLGSTGDPRGDDALVEMAVASSANPFIRDGVLTSVPGRELEFLEKLRAHASWTASFPGQLELTKSLAACIQNQARPDRVARLLELVSLEAETATARQIALLEGMLSVAPTPDLVKKKRIRFAETPKGYEKLMALPSTEVAKRVKKLEPLLTWPGRPGYEPPPAIKPLTPKQTELFELGKTLYSVSCASCHQPTGLGLEGTAPPLVDSEWVLGSEERLVRIVLHGLKGPISVKGRTYEQIEMPGLSSFEDEHIAGILTYIRREWGHGANPVEAEAVKNVRSQTEKRQEAWTQEELLRLK